MKSQDRRDEETVTIFGALLVFLLVAVAGALVLGVATVFLPLGGDLLTVLGYAVLAGAAVALIRYIYRQRRS